MPLKIYGVPIISLLYRLSFKTCI